jgi:tetratricopeptide (TPR) repeat protein
MTLPAFDPLWNYRDPAGTEQKFRELLDAGLAADDKSYAAELLTQIARTQGLQQKYADALATLNESERLITPEMKQAYTRILLERGRVLNSSGKAEDAVPFFERALHAAKDAGLEFHAVDAAHMLGIACKNETALAWNEEAIRMAEAAADPRARNWLGPLYNNTAWTYHEMGRHSDALNLFERDIAYRTSRDRPVEAGIARWSAAKMMRHLGRFEQALQIQHELLKDPERQNNDSEGYGREEIAECLLAMDRSDEATPHFARAWELLHEDQWLRQDEPQRLERLKALGKIQ